MIKCLDSFNEMAACDKHICCAQCPDWAGCDNACQLDPACCQYAIQEGEELPAMRKAYADAIQKISDLTLQKKQIEDAEKKIKGDLCKAMREFGVKSFDNGKVKFTYIAPTTKSTFDSAKLKEDMPEVAAKYTKTSPVSDYVKIEVKKK